MIILPDEILLFIVGYLLPAHLKTLRRVSRRLSRIAATYQYRRVIIYDLRGHQRIQTASSLIGPHLRYTKTFHIHAKFPIRHSFANPSLLNALLEKPNKLENLSIVHHINVRFTLSRFPSVSLNPPSLLHLTRIQIVGVRPNFELFRHVPALKEFTLDLAQHALSAPLNYTEDELKDVVVMLSESCKQLENFTMSLGRADLDYVSHISMWLPRLKGLNLIAGGLCDFMPLISVLPIDMTTRMDDLTCIISRFASLERLSLPYFLSAPFPDEWHETNDPFRTGVTFYLSPTSTALNPIPIYVSYPSIREACDTLRLVAPSLKYAEWCTPANCTHHDIAKLGPFALKIVGWEYVQEDDEPGMWIMAHNTRREIIEGLPFTLD